MLALLGCAAALPNCRGRSGAAVRVGSKNFTESQIVAEIYAQSLESHGIAVERRMNLGSVQIVLSALQRGDVDLYPEYTGTALVDVLHRDPIRDPKTIYDVVSREFAALYDLRWLTPSPLDDSQALATTQAVARAHGLRTLSQLAVQAPQLRLATIPEFVGRKDGLPGLQKYYGGFKFANVRTYDIGLKYEALLHGQADVATAFTTDGEIGANNLVVLDDDRHFWPPYNVAPVVRNAALRAHPQIQTILDRVSPFVTNVAAQQMNYAVDHDKRDPADVAAQFLKEHRF
jgi:osmoprotectant transport system substrate-binding protein